MPEMGGLSDHPDFDVLAVVTGDEVSVSYRPPGAGVVDSRVELAPIPLRFL